MAEVTVFGAGAMGTAVAMHAARIGLDTALWANPFDATAMESIREKGKHPGLPDHVPATLALFGPDELEAAARAPFVVSLGKGLEPHTAKRMSELYHEEFPDATVVAVGGPGLAGEL